MNEVLGNGNTEMSTRVDPMTALTSFFERHPDIEARLWRGGLPLLFGTVQAQYVRCGRDGCRCGRGELHGPYWYLFLRGRRRLRKVYVRPAEVEIIRALCDARRRIVTEARENRRAMQNLIRSYCENVRGVEKLIGGR